MKYLFTVLTLLILSTGCSVYRPKSPIPNSAFSNTYVADLSSPNLISNYDAIPEGPLKVARRNAIIWEIIWLTDQSYRDYESRFFSGQAYLSTAGDVAIIGMSAVSSFTGTAHLKSVLAAVSGSVVGIEASYQKNFFDQATRESIVQVMRAARLAKLAEIEQGMASCSTSTVCGSTGSFYSLEQGLLDATDYYDAGTIVGALISISNTSSIQALQARQIMRSLKGIKIQ